MYIFRFRRSIDKTTVVEKIIMTFGLIPERIEIGLLLRHPDRLFEITSIQSYFLIDAGNDETELLVLRQISILINDQLRFSHEQAGEEMILIPQHGPTPLQMIDQGMFMLGENEADFLAAVRSYRKQPTADGDVEEWRLRARSIDKIWGLVDNRNRSPEIYALQGERRWTAGVRVRIYAITDGSRPFEYLEDPNYKPHEYFQDGEILGVAGLTYRCVFEERHRHLDGRIEYNGRIGFFHTQQERLDQTVYESRRHLTPNLLDKHTTEIIIDEAGNLYGRDAIDGLGAWMVLYTWSEGKLRREDKFFSGENTSGRQDVGPLQE